MTRRLPIVPLLAALALFAAAPAHAVRCFEMYDARNNLVLQTASPPIDLSRAVADQMTRRYPGRFLVISDFTTCPNAGVTVATTPTSAASILRTQDPYPADPSPVGAPNANSVSGPVATSYPAYPQVTPDDTSR